jgi:glycosyltransferase involved in cell wall biosynthesis
VDKPEEIQFSDSIRNYIDSQVQAKIDLSLAEYKVGESLNNEIIYGALSDLGNLLSGRKIIPIRNISVIIPTKDRFNRLLKALKSCSWQTRLPSEVIIVNDGNVFSEKENVEIASILGEDCPFIVLGNQHHGAAGARKTGAQFATSEILTYLDDDNLMWPTWLESVDREFKLDSDQLIYGAQLRKQWYNSILAEPVYSHQRICQGNFIDTGCIAHHKNFGKWDEKLNIIEDDWDFVLSIAAEDNSRIRYIPEIASIYFTDAVNRISTTKQQGREILVEKYQTFFELNSR